MLGGSAAAFGGGGSTAYPGTPPSRCAECGNVLTDALVLSCGHDLCLGCAANALRQTRSLTNRMVRCLLCPSTTELCEEAAAALGGGSGANNGTAPQPMASHQGQPLSAGLQMPCSSGCGGAASSTCGGGMTHPYSSSWMHGGLPVPKPQTQMNQSMASGSIGGIGCPQEPIAIEPIPTNFSIDSSKGRSASRQRGALAGTNTPKGGSSPRMGPRWGPSEEIDLFGQLDKNKDGVISRSEWNGARQQVAVELGMQQSPNWAVDNGAESQRAGAGEFLHIPRCPEHPEEPAMYFCATCECECICAECVVQKNGRHRDHEVMRATRAHEALRARAGALMDEAVALEDDFAMVTDRLAWRRKDVERAAARGRASVRSAFARVRAQLTDREAELLESLDVYESNSLGRLDNGSSEHGTHLNELRRLQESLRARCRNGGDAVEALNTYAAAKGAISNLREAFRQDEVMNAGPPDDFVGLAGSARAELDLHAEGLASLEEAVASLCERGVENPAARPPDDRSAPRGPRNGISNVERMRLESAVNGAPSGSIAGHGSTQPSHGCGAGFDASNSSHANDAAGAQWRPALPSSMPRRGGP